MPSSWFFAASSTLSLHRRGPACLLAWVLGVAAGCAHSPPPRPDSDGPSREDVRATMDALTPAIARCVPPDRKSLQVKLALDGQEGVVVRADLLPDTLVVCGEGKPCASEAAPEPLDLTVLQCVRSATVGQPGPEFEAAGFNLTFRVARPPEPKR